MMSKTPSQSILLHSASSTTIALSKPFTMRLHYVALTYVISRTYFLARQCKKLS